MAMAVSTDNALALTVSADHIIGRYDLAVGCHGTFFILVVSFMFVLGSKPRRCPLVQPIEQNILEILPLPYGVTGRSVLSEVGMESE